MQNQGIDTVQFERNLAKPIAILMYIITTILYSHNS